MAQQERRRIFPRIHLVRPCRLTWEDGELNGHTKNLSYGGVAVTLPPDVPWLRETTHLVVLPEAITLGVRPVRLERTEAGTTMAFEIESVERGALEWEQLVYRPRW